VGRRAEGRAEHAFWLLTTLSGGAAPTAGRYALVALGLMTKPMLVTLPLTLPCRRLAARAPVRARPAGLSSEAAASRSPPRRPS
jgi:hypothetical protein